MGFYNFNTGSEYWILGQMTGVDDGGVDDGMDSRGTLPTGSRWNRRRAGAGSDGLAPKARRGGFGLGGSGGYALGLLVMWLGSVALRFWGLGRFNELVFDEVHYVKFAHQYLTEQPLFDAHPPLAKYLIALGVWVGEHWWFHDLPKVAVLDTGISPLSYRWMNALVGSWIPLAIAGIAYELTRRRTYGLIAGLFATLEGYYLVESRYALLHVYLVLFGLLGHWAMLKALNQTRGRWLWWLAAGVSFGCCVSVKWNGLGYLLGPAIAWGGCWLWAEGRWILGKGLPTRVPPEAGAPLATPLETPLGTPLMRLWEVPPWVMVLVLGLIPAGVYLLQWLPHLSLNSISLQAVHGQMLGFHERLGGNSKTVHPYCAAWWTWPLLLRPIAYYFQKSDDGAFWFDVHGLGNPILWWLSTLAVGLVLLRLGRIVLGYGPVLGWVTRWVTWVAPWIWPPPKKSPGGWGRWAPLWGSTRVGHLASTTAAAVPTSVSPTILPPPASRDRAYLGILAYLALNYVTNWLPWSIVSRCTFIYHHLGSVAFGLLTLALLVTRWLQLQRADFPSDSSGLGEAKRLAAGWRAVAITLMFAVAIAFVWWLPIYLGLPLTPTGYRLRMWLPSWV